MSASTLQREKRRVVHVALILALATLNGCALFEKKPAPPPPPEPQAAEPVAPAAPPEPPPPRPARKPRPPAPGTVTGSESAEPAVPLPPEHVIGLGQEDTENWLGHPTERNEVPPAQIWRYLSRDCEINVYFYLDLQSKMMRALHYDVRGSDNNDRGAEHCFQQIVAERHERDDSTPANHPR